MYARLLILLVACSTLAVAQPAIITSVENRYILQEGEDYFANVTVKNYEASAMFNISLMINGVLDSSTLVTINGNYTEQFFISPSGSAGECHNLTFLLFDSLGTTLYDQEEAMTCVIARIPRKPEQIIVPEYPTPALLVFPFSVFFIARRKKNGVR